MTSAASTPIRSLADFTDLHRRLKAARAQRAGQPAIRICAGAGCIASGSMELKGALEAELARRRITARILCTGCLGPCARGPVAVVDPAGAWIENATADRAAEIVERYLAPDATPPQDGTLAAMARRQTKIVLRNCGRIDPSDLDDAIACDAYAGLAKVLGGMTPDQVIAEMKTSGLRGRGGAGFPTWMKWSFTRKAAGAEKYILCNADEGDPGAFMDRSVLEGDPHSVIEGMAIGAFAIGAGKGYVYVRAEYPLAVDRLTTAIAQARSRGLLGTGILGTGFAFDLQIRMGSGAFVCGEETALMASIEGRRGEPRPRPPFPAEKGLWGKPTCLNNVETFANVPVILLEGGAAFARLGTEKSKGTKVFALAGAVADTGLVEVPVGTSLGELIYDVGGGIKGGKPFKAAQIGGPSGGCIPREHLNVPLDYESLTELGAIMGSGGLIVMDDDACMVDVARFFLEFVQEESCGKCVPCRVGTRRMLEILERICAGKGEMADLDRLTELGRQIKQTSLCGLGQTAPNPVLSTLRHFRHEYIEHIRDRHCRAGVCPALVRAPCQSACPAGVDVPGFVSLVAEKRYADALRLHRERNPFAAVCARVCFHTCEDKCRRAALDSAVSIRGVKRFMVDQEVTVQVPEVREDAERAARKVAVIGAGPAGLSCAYFLARLGYRPTIFEAESRPGGMLVQTIPAYRLPRETLAREIRMIERLGVDLRTGQRLGRDLTLDGLVQQGYEAVFLGLGAPDSVALRLPGGDGPGVVQAMPFLQEYNIRGSVKVGRRVIVVGGGNAAIDAARTALRLGTEAVTVVYRRTREQMPAWAEEIDAALAEGVVLLTLTAPTAIERGADGTIRAVRCQRMELGEFDASGRRKATAGAEEVVLEADQVIAAIGQRLDLGVVAGVDLTRTDDGFIAADPTTGQTSIDWIFAGGDAASGPASVVTAIGAGERAAIGIDVYLTGRCDPFWRQARPSDTAFDPEADPAPTPREPIGTIPVERRRHNFDEVELPWAEAAANRQAHRCLRCDYGKCTATVPEITAEQVRGARP